MKIANIIPNGNVTVSLQGESRKGRKESACGGIEMKKTAILSIGLMCLMTLSLLAPVASASVVYPSVWTTGTALGGTRMQATVVQVANGTIYIMGGTTGTATSTAVNYANSSDPSTGAWRNLAPMPQATRGAVGGVGNDGKIYVISGAQGGTVAFTQIYDPIANSWTTGTDIPTPTWAAQGGCDGDNVYVISGNVGTAVQIYDISGDSWSTGTAIPTETRAGGSIIDNGFIYIIGGDTVGGLTDTVYRYNIGGDSWDTMTSMPFPICAQGVALVDGVIYSFGGASDSFNNPPIAYSLCQYYDINSDTTGVVNYLNIPRAWAGGAAFEGKIFALGGDNETVTTTGAFASVEVLDTTITITGLQQEVKNLKQQLTDTNAALDSTQADLTNQVDLLNAKIANLTAELNQTQTDLNNAIDAANNNANSKAGDAKTAADNANMMALIGIIVGIIGIVLAAVAIMMAMKKGGKGPQMAPQQGQAQQ